MNGWSYQFRVIWPEASMGGRFHVHSLTCGCVPGVDPAPLPQAKKRCPRCGQLKDVPFMGARGREVKWCSDCTEHNNEEIRAYNMRKREPVEAFGPLRKIIFRGEDVNQLECGHYVLRTDERAERRRCDVCGLEDM